MNLLKEQGMKDDQKIIFLSDGAETVRQLQYYISPNAVQVLDWFHITMKITVLKQFVKGLINVDSKNGKAVERYLTSVKWNLWNGNIKKSLLFLNWMDDSMRCFEETYSKFSNLEKKLYEFITYIENNVRMIPNYGKAYRSGFPISTSFVESTVNALSSKRFSKKQQMQWTEEGAHLLMQVRTKTMNNELSHCFKKWYKDFKIEENFDDKELQFAA